MSNPIIQVKNLRKVYRIGTEQVVALEGINLDIAEGEVCCIVGTSGSGKSTLLNQLAGLEKPSKGQVMIAGKNISRLTENQLARFRQKNVGFVFQSYNLMTAITALENVQMPLVFRGMDKAKREKAARRILKEVGLADRMRHKPSQMSGGQQQRVGIARAFVAKPKIIFADEPTGNLDTRTTVEVMQMMVRLCKENNQTLILVTHDMEISQYADRVVTIRDGNIVADVPGPLPQILDALMAKRTVPEDEPEHSESETPEDIEDADALARAVGLLRGEEHDTELGPGQQTKGAIVRQDAARGEDDEA